MPTDATELRIQETCFQFAALSLLDVVTTEERIAIESEIYEQEGNRANVLMVYGILFRNAFFKERNIPAPEDADNHSQNIDA